MTGKKLTRLLSLLLTVALVFSLVALPVYADEDGTADSGEVAVTTTDSDSTGDASGTDDANTNADEGSDSSSDNTEAEATEEQSESKAEEPAEEETGEEDAEEETNGESDSSDEGESADESAGEDASEEETATEDNDGISLTSADGGGTETNEEVATNVASITSGEETSYYTTLQAAIDAATSGDTITLIANTSEDVTIPSEANITLNLGNYTLTNSSSDTITVSYGATLTIEGSGTVDNVTHTYAAIYNNGTVTLNGGTYTRSLENGSSNTYYTILNHGTMTINSGVTVSNTGNNSSMIDNGYYSYTSTNPRAGYVSGTNAANPSLTINGGTFSGGINTIKNDDCATLTISGGTFTNYTQASVQNHSTATISGGTFTAENAYAVLNCGCDATYDQGVLKISGGTFTGSYAVMDESTASTATITITGGNFQGSTADIATWSSTDGIKTDSTVSTATISVSGGTFSSDVSAYAAEGYEATTNEEGKYVVTSAKVAQIGETTYGTLAAAFAAASDGQTITLLTDITLSSGITLSSKSVTLDLNGCTVSRVEDYSYNYLINVASDASLTVKDSTGSGGALSNTYGNYISGYAIQAEGTVIVESGTLKAIYGIYANGANAQVTVNNGTVYGYYYGIYVSGANAQVTVNNGTVTGNTRGISISSSATSSTVNISGGTVKGTSTSSYSYGIIQFAGTLNITGGTVSGANGYGIQANGTLKIDGENVNISGTYAGIYCNGSSSEIKSGTITGTVALAVYGTTTAVTIGDSTNTSSTAPTLTGSTAYGIEMGNGADVTIYSGTVSGPSCGVFVGYGYDADNPTILVVNGGTISSDSIGISTNGSQNYTNITINGGSVSGGWGMYLPAMNSSTTINGGTITGSSTGVEIRAGSLTVSGGTIESTSGEFAYTFNGSGTTVVGAGIAISQHSTNQEVTVTITGGEISGIYGIFEVNTYSTSTEDVTLTISGDSTSVSGSIAAVYSVSLNGDVTGLVEGVTTYSSETTTVAISAGTYSTEVSEYCEEGYLASLVVDESGNYTITSGVAAVYDADGSLLRTYSTLYEASTTAASDSTIKLTGDVGTSDFCADDYFRADSSKTLTLDLNGHNIYAASGENTGSKSTAILVTGNATLDIVDNSGNGGVVTTSGTKAVWMISGKLTIDAVGYTWTGANNAVYVCSQSDYSEGTTTLIINSGVFYGQAAVAVKNDKGDTKINGGVFVGYSSSTKATAIAGGSGTGTVTITYGYFAGSLSPQSSKFTISGGYYTVGVSASDSITFPKGMSCITLSESEKVTEKVTGTEFTYKVDYYTFSYGTISEDGMYTTLGSASSIYNLCTAINGDENITDGSEVFIQMHSDYTTSGTLDVNSITKCKNITIDLNGYTLECTGESTAAITVQYGYEVTILDSSAEGTGTVTASSVSPYGTIKNRGGNLTIESGTFINSASSSNLVVNNNGGTGASTTITGGSFKGTFYALSGTTLSIEGGYFDNDPTTYVATGYEVAKNEEDEDYPYYVADIIYGKNIDLKSGTIALNVYVMGVVDSEDYISGAPYVEGSSTNPEVSAVESEEYAYTVSQKVLAENMAKELTVTVNLSNGYTYEYATSVKSYAADVMDSLTDANEKAALTAMLDYGSAVQALGGTTSNDDLANGGNYADGVTSVTATDIKNYGASKTTAKVGIWAGVTLSSWNMTFKDDFTIIMKYSGEITESVTVSIGGEPYSNVTTSGQYITISGLSAYDLTKSLSVTLTSGDTSYTTNTTGLYYARLMAGSTSTAQKLVGQTLYLYAKAVAALNTAG
ncbi:MAG: hypothetical protein LJU34_03365 [Oscillospiraceae bacterium]|nr:hypothetical protein [Oscillospiraceae bacterium]